MDFDVENKCNILGKYFLGDGESIKLYLQKSGTVRFFQGLDAKLYESCRLRKLARTVCLLFLKFQFLSCNILTCIYDYDKENTFNILIFDSLSILIVSNRNSLRS